MSAAAASIGIAIPVYNGADTIARALDSLLRASRAQAARISIAVCDDGSTDDTATLLAGCTDARLRVVTHERNTGRAQACNDAAATLDCDFLLFLDADCEPLDERYFETLTAGADSGADLVYGPIVGRAEGDWRPYLDAVEQRRNRDAAAGRHLRAMTTCNLLVRRDRFVSAGGFCADYRHCGFEDKDLVARLLDGGPQIVFDPDLAVAHEAGNTVDSYCRKMYEAGRHTAPLFRQRLPAAYQGLSFARIDPALRGAFTAAALRGIGRLGAPPVRALARSTQALPWLPRPTRIQLLRLAAAASFLEGAAHR